jgi:hypothetical protein
MLSQWQIDRIQGLLAQGKRQRQIHALTGIARGTIAGIAHGHRPDYGAIRRAKSEQSRTTPEGPLARCFGCGHYVHLPCRICATRRWKLIRLLCHDPQEVPELLEPLGLDLLPEHRLRYERVRARRERASGCQSRRVVSRAPQESSGTFPGPTTRRPAAKSTDSRPARGASSSEVT